MATTTYKVKGMHCASCATIINKRIKKQPGVTESSVNFATEKATISADKEISVNAINKEIQPLGYELVTSHEHHAGMKHEQMNHTIQGMDHSEHLGLNQTKQEKLQELAEQKGKVEFALPIAFLVFVIMMWDIAARFIQSVPNLPIPMQLLNTLLFILATPFIFWIGKPFIRGVATFLRHGAANMDTLIGIGTLTAYLYSAVIVLFPPIRSILGVPEYVYFDVTIVVIGFVILGKYLEARSKLRTGDAIEKLIGLQAKFAHVLRNGIEKEIPISDVVVGDIVLVKPGGKIPVDGVITQGGTSIDESMVTGESVPVDKRTGDLVIGSTINKQGSIQFRALKVGSDTMLSQIISLVENAQGSKAPIQALADKISGIFVPIVLAVAFLSLALWLIIGSQYIGITSALSYGLLSFVGVLVIACPCALGLATPTAIIVGVGKGAEHGILIKDAESLQKIKQS